MTRVCEGAGCVTELMLMKCKVNVMTKPILDVNIIKNVF